MLNSTDLLTIKQALESQILAVEQIKRESNSGFLKESCDNNIKRCENTLEKINDMREE